MTRVHNGIINTNFLRGNNQNSLVTRISCEHLRVAFIKIYIKKDKLLTLT